MICIIITEYPCSVCTSQAKTVTPRVVQQTYTAAKNEESHLQYLVAMHLHPFNFINAFLTKWQSLCRFYHKRVVLLCGGTSVIIPVSSTNSMMSS